MIVSGVHLSDKKAAHVLLSYQAQQPQYKPPPPPPPSPRPLSFPANPGLSSSLGSADSGDWVLNIPTPTLHLPRLEYDLASTQRKRRGLRGGQRWVGIGLGPH